MPCTYVHLRFCEPECVSIQTFKYTRPQESRIVMGFHIFTVSTLVVKEYNISEILLV